MYVLSVTYIPLHAAAALLLFHLSYFPVPDRRCRGAGTDTHLRGQPVGALDTVNRQLRKHGPSSSSQQQAERSVDSHCGIPGNEEADTLAEQGGQRSAYMQGSPERSSLLRPRASKQGTGRLGTRATITPAASFPKTLQAFSPATLRALDGFDPQRPPPKQTPGGLPMRGREHLHPHPPGLPPPQVATPGMTCFRISTRIHASITPNSPNWSPSCEEQGWASPRISAIGRSMTSRR